MHIRLFSFSNKFLNFDFFSKLSELIIIFIFSIFLFYNFIYKFKILSLALEIIINLLSSNRDLFIKFEINSS